MSKNSPDSLTLRGLIERAGAGSRAVVTPEHRVAFADFAAASPFGEARARLAGLSVILHVRDMALAAAALIDLDGLSRRIVLAPPGWGAAELESAALSAEADAIAHDRLVSPVKIELEATLALPMRAVALTREPALETEWVLPTSGTTGPPKLVVHTLATLTGAIDDAPRQQWATFYDIRRYGGLQVFLRALSGSGSLWVNGPDETLEAFLVRLGEAGVTHISGTPSHWRKALMSGEAGRIDPEYVRLSGEIADDAILAALGEQYPRARIEHAYASTEAGVAFTVGDGKAGFPAALVEAGGAVKMRVVDGALQLKSERTALRFLGEQRGAARRRRGFRRHRRHGRAPRRSLSVRRTARRRHQRRRRQGASGGSRSGSQRAPRRAGEPGVWAQERDHRRARRRRRRAQRGRGLAGRVGARDHGSVPQPPRPRTRRLRGCASSPNCR